MSDAYSKQDQSETISNLEAVIYKLNEIDQKVKIFKDAVSESRGELSEFNRDKNELDNWYSATMKEIQSLLQYKLEK